ncbi:hypothetical protein BJ322DRAFT_1037476, partial [Thelephora terrestris]
MPGLHPLTSFDVSKTPQAPSRSQVGRLYLLETQSTLLEVCLVAQTILIFYQKGGGKNGRHGWILYTPNVHSVSNVGVQLFEYAYLRMFRAVHEADALLQTKCHKLIPARQLLT